MHRRQSSTNPIELEIWKQKEDDPRYAEYAGQPVAEAVFVELKQRLDSMGMLPDEYFLMDTEWGNGREIPKGADVFVAVDYGAANRKAVETGDIRVLF